MESAPNPAASEDLRRRIFLRLGVAAMVLAGVAVAWMATGPAETESNRPSAAGGAPIAVHPSNAISPGKPAPAAAPSQPANAMPEPAPHQSEQSVDKDAVEGTSPRAATGTVGSSPVQEQPATVATAPSEPPAVNVLPKGPYLQIGVFIHPANAAALKAKLEAAGIPVQTATRVQVGPFKNKKEAEAAREKLKAMGLASVPINQ